MKHKFNFIEVKFKKKFKLHNYNIFVVSAYHVLSKRSQTQAPRHTEPQHFNPLYGYTMMEHKANWNSLIK